jgi:hypothetical protein
VSAPLRLCLLLLWLIPALALLGPGLPGMSGLPALEAPAIAASAHLPEQPGAADLAPGALPGTAAPPSRSMRARRPPRGTGTGRPRRRPGARAPPIAQG